MNLPEKLSDVIDGANIDFEAKLNDPRYEINLGRYHAPFGKTCHICYSGSVMAGTLEGDITRGLSPSDFNKHNRDRLFALNHIREGNIWGALIAMGIPHPEGLEGFMPVNQKDFEQLIKDTAKIANRLREFNL